MTALAQTTYDAPTTTIDPEVVALAETIDITKPMSVQQFGFPRRQAMHF